MSIIELLILSVALAMDAFAVSICKGLSVKEIKTKHMLLAGIWFGGFQALMPVLGYACGTGFANVVDKYDHWIAFIILLIIGVQMIRESYEKEEVNSNMDFKTMFFLAVATSIDALTVGITFAFFDVNIVVAVLFIGVITFVISAMGVKIGSIFGDKYKSKAEIAGGVVLILIGLKTLLTGLSII
jgi:putative Mn2+ efflux pump MntP